MVWFKILRVVLCTMTMRRRCDSKGLPLDSWTGLRLDLPANLPVFLWSSYRLLQIDRYGDGTRGPRWMRDRLCHIGCGPKPLGILPSC